MDCTELELILESPALVELNRAYDSDIHQQQCRSQGGERPLLCASPESLLSPLPTIRNTIGSPPSVHRGHRNGNMNRAELLDCDGKMMPHLLLPSFDDAVFDSRSTSTSTITISSTSRSAFTLKRRRTPFLAMRTDSDSNRPNLNFVLPDFSEESSNGILIVNGNDDADTIHNVSTPPAPARHSKKLDSSSFPQQHRRPSFSGKMIRRTSSGAIAA